MTAIGSFLIGMALGMLVVEAVIPLVARAWRRYRFRRLIRRSASAIRLYDNFKADLLEGYQPNIVVDPLMGDWQPTGEWQGKLLLEPTADGKRPLPGPEVTFAVPAGTLAELPVKPEDLTWRDGNNTPDVKLVKPLEVNTLAGIGRDDLRGSTRYVEFCRIDPDTHQKTEVRMYLGQRHYVDGTLTIMPGGGYWSSDGLGRGGVKVTPTDEAEPCGDPS